MNGNEKEQEKYPRESRGDTVRRASDVGPQLQPERAVDRAEKAVAATLSPRDEAFEEINHERAYQDRRHPESMDLTVGEELVLMTHFVKKAVDMWTLFDGNSGDTAALEQIRKVAAIAVRVMENHGTVPRAGIIEKAMPIPASQGAQIVEDGMRDPTEEELRTRDIESRPKF